MNIEIKEAFERNYEKKLWGYGYDGLKFDYFSGMGSTLKQIKFTETYIKNFCEKFDKKLNISDLGCGAFEVGEKIRKYFNTYDAYDVVPDLIERNKKKYIDLNVNFYFADVCEDFIESNDVALIRHVIQHLNNESIHKLIKNIQEKFDYLIVIQDIHSLEDGIISPFNIGDIRIGDSRGMYNPVCLHEPPYNLQYIQYDKNYEFVKTEIYPDNNKLYYVYRLFQTYKLK